MEFEHHAEEYSTAASVLSSSARPFSSFSSVAVGGDEGVGLDGDYFADTFDLV